MSSDDLWLSCVGMMDYDYELCRHDGLWLWVITLIGPQSSDPSKWNENYEQRRGCYFCIKVSITRIPERIKTSLSMKKHQIKSICTWSGCTFPKHAFWRLSWKTCNRRAGKTALGELYLFLLTYWPMGPCDPEETPCPTFWGSYLDFSYFSDYFSRTWETYFGTDCSKLIWEQFCAKYTRVIFLLQKGFQSNERAARSPFCRPSYKIK